MFRPHSKHADICGAFTCAMRDIPKAALPDSCNTLDSCPGNRNGTRNLI